MQREVVNRHVDDEIWNLDVTELSQAMRERRLSPVEVMNAFLAWIEKLNPVLGAFCLVRDDEARKEAQKAETEIMRGRTKGRLHGIPLGIKDLTWTKDVRTTLGSVIFQDFIPAENAIHVERSLDEGAIIVGKTQISEFGHTGFSRNLLTGAALNPWDQSRTAGGSSGGSASAVAAGMVPAAEGSDAGGSVRGPAACCGIFGLKPQTGRIPNGVGFENVFDDMFSYGPMTWTVRDAALLLSVWSGRDERDPLSLPLGPHDFAGRLVESLSEKPREVRVAYSRDLGIGVEPEVADVMERAVRVLEDLGCRIDEVAIGQGDEARMAWTVWYRTFYSASYARYVEEYGDRMTPFIVDTIGKGQAVSAVEYYASQVARSNYYKQLYDLFQQYELLVSPTLRRLPPTADRLSSGPDFVAGRPADPIIGWSLMSPFNLTTHPAASIPAGFAANGIPVGMQIIGPRCSEEEILALAARFEMAAPWRGTRPTVQVLPDADGMMTR